MVSTFNRTSTNTTIRKEASYIYLDRRPKLKGMFKGLMYELVQCNKQIIKLVRELYNIGCEHIQEIYKIIFFRC